MDQKPEVRIKVRPAGIPPELTELPRWIVWKHMWSKKQSKWVKAPYQVSGSLASSTDASTWSTFGEACAVLNGYDGLGFVFNGDGITGIDLDKVIDERGRWSDTATQALQDVTGYAELSPSGRGLHIITRAPHIGTGKSKGGIEAYSTGRYFTFTGHQLNGHASVPSSEQDIAPFLAAHFGEVARSAAPVNDLDEALSKLPTGKTIGHMALVLRHVKTPDYEPECTPYIWAIHHEASGSAEGLQLAHDWCSGKLHDKEYPEYDFDYVEERWARSRDDKGNAKTWRSIEFEAKKNGWREEHKPRATSGNPFAVHGWADYKQNYLSTPWIVKGVLPQAEVGILYGQSGSGKTFFVLDLAATIARNAEWRGRRVSSTRVVYVAAEAREGIKKRMDAYDQHVCPDGARPDIIASAPNLLSSDTAQLAEAIGRAGLIILDTMAASHSGDENSAKDMGLFLAACKDLSHATGAMVLAVHHTGKEESKGMRGSSALFAGADFVMEVFKNDKEHGALLSKSRDDITGTSFSFVLKRVVVGHDDDGDEVTTCVVEPIQKEVAKAARSKKPQKLANQGDSRYDFSREMLALIEKMVDESGSGKVHKDQIFDTLLLKYPGKMRKNLAVVLLRLEQLGAIRQTLDWYEVAEDEEGLG